MRVDLSLATSLAINLKLDLLYPQLPLGGIEVLTVSSTLYLGFPQLPMGGIEVLTVVREGQGIEPPTAVWEGEEMDPLVQGKETFLNLLVMMKICLERLNKVED